MTEHLSRFFDSEVAGLAPWIASNLNLLAAATGMQELRPVRPESPVGPFRLDLLATGVTSDAATVPVAIEVQLGTADHDHLGKLVTYLAHQGRGVGIWIADRATHPHLTAVDFLNRSTGNELSWWLITLEQDVGEWPDPAQARVSVLAGPGVPLPPRPVRASPVGAVRSHPTRTEFLQDVLEAVAEPSMTQGWRNPRITNKGYAITWALPAESTLRRTAVKLRCHPDEIVVHLLVQGYDAVGNQRVVEAVKEHYGGAIEAALPRARFQWDAGQRSAESLRIAVPGVSWEGDAQAAPEVVLTCLEALEEPVRDRRIAAAGEAA